MPEEESEILDQEEVDALLEAVSGRGMDIDFGDAIARGQVTPYDFKRPERVSREQIRSLEMLHEVYARNLGAALSGHLRTIVEVRLETVEQLTYSEFITSLPNPTFFNVLSCEPMEGNVMLEINPAIVFPIYDRLMGGGEISTEIPDRPLTDIEWRITDRVLERALDELKNEWKNIKQIELEVTQQESNPQLIQLIPPNELVILISFEVVMGEHSGMMNLCIPFMVLEPVIAELNPQTWYGYTRGEAEESEESSAIVSSITDAELEITVDLVETEISLEDLINLEPGDKILTDKSKDSPVVVRVGDQPKYIGKPGIGKQGRRAVKIIKEISEKESFKEELREVAEETLEEDEENENEGDHENETN